jgi:hypothetical protein
MTAQVRLQMYFLIFLASVAASRVSAQQKKLSFNPTPNTIYDCGCKFHSEQNENGNSVTSELDMTFDVSTITRTDSLVTLRVAYRKLKMDVVASDMNLHVDSDNPMPTKKQLQENAGTTMLKAIKTLMGHAYTLTLKPTGEVMSVTGFEKMLDVAMDSIAFNPVARSYLRKSLAAQFGDEPMRNTFNQMFNVLPDSVVRENATWTTQANNLTHTLKTSTKATAGVSSRTAIAVEATPLTDGDMLIDVKTGLPIRVDMTQRDLNQRVVGTTSVRCAVPATK